MYGELSLYEYAKALDKADKRDSTGYCKVSHNNLGWVGVYAYTPHNRYCIVHYNQFSDDDYYKVMATSNRAGSYGRPIVDIKFKELKDALLYLEEHNM